MYERPTLSELLGAFWEYERALMANDLPALDRLLDPRSVPPGTAIAVNVKADGLAAAFAPWFDRTRELDVFFFDM